MVYGIQQLSCIDLGYKVVAEGSDAYTEWFDLVHGGLGTQLFAIFGGELR